MPTTDDARAHDALFQNDEEGGIHGWRVRSFSLRVFEKMRGRCVSSFKVGGGGMKEFEYRILDTTDVSQTRRTCEQCRRVRRPYILAALNVTVVDNLGEEHSAAYPPKVFCTQRCINAALVRIAFLEAR